MPRGPKKHVTQYTPAEEYGVSAVINTQIADGRLNGTALKLWLQLKMLSWERGECDLTDEELRALLHGVARDTIRLARQELRDAHLLVEYTCPDESGRATRRLIPLPAPETLAPELPPLAAARLRHQTEALLATTAPTPPEITPDASGARNDPVLPALINKEQKENEDKKEVGTPSEFQSEIEAAPTGPDDNPAAAEGVAPTRWGPPPGTVEYEIAELAAFLNYLGAYEHVAERLAEGLLGRLDLPQSMVMALALKRDTERRAANRGAWDARWATATWVLRLREKGARPSKQAVLDAQAELLTRRSPLRPDLPPPPTCASPGVAAPQSEPEPPPPLEEPTLQLHGASAPLSQVWQAALNRLRMQTTQSMFNERLRFTEPVGLAEEDRVLVVAAPTAPTAEFLNRRLDRVVGSVARDLLGEGYTVRFIAREE